MKGGSIKTNLLGWKSHEKDQANERWKRTKEWLMDFDHFLPLVVVNVCFVQNGFLWRWNKIMDGVGLICFNSWQ